MAWDDDKSTATDPDNPSASEQLTADEWDNHVGDQLSRLEYGPLSNRPAASEREQGALWFDEHGRISRVDANGNWVLDSFGTSSNPVPDTSHFNAISTDEITIGATGPVTGTVGDSGEWLPLFPIGNYQFNNSWTSTSYDRIHSGVRKFVIDEGTLPNLVPTGIETYGIALWVSELNIDTDGETATIRLHDDTNNVSYPDTELSHTGGAGATSELSLVQEFQHNGTLEFEGRGKVTAGTGNVRYYKSILCGRIA